MADGGNATALLLRLLAHGHELLLQCLILLLQRLGLVCSLMAGLLLGLFLLSCNLVVLLLLALLWLIVHLAVGGLIGVGPGRWLVFEIHGKGWAVGNGE